MGRVGVISSAAAFLAGYNLRLLTVVQAMSQLDAVYGDKEARTFATNHGLQILYAPREQRDADEYSAMLGQFTERATSRGRSRSFSQHGHSSVSRNESEQRRALLLPQEFKELGSERLVVIFENCKPILGEKIRYHRDKAFTARLLPAAGRAAMDMDLHLARVQQRWRYADDELAPGRELGRGGAGARLPGCCRTASRARRRGRRRRCSTSSARPRGHAATAGDRAWAAVSSGVADDDGVLIAATRQALRRLHRRAALSLSRQRSLESPEIPGEPPCDRCQLLLDPLCCSLLASCSSPPKPPTVDESQKRPANSAMAVELQVCKSDLQNTRILAAESGRIARRPPRRHSSAKLRASKHIAAVAAAQAAATGQPRQRRRRNSVFTVHFDFGSTRLSHAGRSGRGTGRGRPRRAAGHAARAHRRHRPTTPPKAASRASARRPCATTWSPPASTPARIRATYQPAGDHARRQHHRSRARPEPARRDRGVPGAAGRDGLSAVATALTHLPFSRHHLRGHHGCRQLPERRPQPAQARRHRRTRQPRPDRQGAFQTPLDMPGERYELRDPFAEVTYRANTFPEMIAKADQLGSTRFVAVDADGKRTTIEKVDGEWQRGPQRPAAARAAARRRRRRATRCPARRRTSAPMAGHNRQHPCAGRAAPTRRPSPRSTPRPNAPRWSPGSKPR